MRLGARRFPLELAAFLGVSAFWTGCWTTPESTTDDVPKGSGPRHVYFTAAGGAVDYNLHVGRLELEVDTEGVRPR